MEIPNSQKVICNNIAKIEQGTFDMKTFIEEFEKLQTENISPKLIIKEIIDAVQQKIRNSSHQKILHYSEKMIDWILESYSQRINGINDVLFFPSIENEYKLLNYFKQAKKSLLISMINLWNPDIINTMNELYKAGLDIKVILNDNELIEERNSIIITLSKKDWNIRKYKDKSLFMQNSFAIIDDIFIVSKLYSSMSNSTNKNQDYFLIIKNDQAVRSFKKQFDDLWNISDEKIFKQEGGVILNKVNSLKKFLKIGNQNNEERIGQYLESSLIPIHSVYIEDQNNQSFSINNSIDKTSNLSPKLESENDFDQKSSIFSILKRTKKIQKSKKREIISPRINLKHKWMMAKVKLLYFLKKNLLN